MSWFEEPLLAVISAQTSLFGPFAEMENYATYKGPCEEHFLTAMSLANAR